MNFSNIQKQGKIGLLHAAAKIPIPPQRAKLHQSRVHPGQHSWSQWQRYAPVASWGVALATGGRVALNLQLAAAGRSWPERYLHRSFWHVRRLKQNATSRAGKNGM